MRGAPKERPATLTAPPDGQTLEKLIGELQSEWGVPQYPQEYRITIKVADERDARPERAPAAEPRREAAASGASPSGPKREKAPAAPRVGATGTVEREPAPKRRRGRRRRRRGSEPGRTPESAAATTPTSEPVEVDDLGSQGDGPEFERDLGSQGGHPPEFERDLGSQGGHPAED